MPFCPEAQPEQLPQPEERFLFNLKITPTKASTIRINKNQLMLFMGKTF